MDLKEAPNEDDEHEDADEGLHFSASGDAKVRNRRNADDSEEPGEEEGKGRALNPEEEAKRIDEMMEEVHGRSDLDLQGEGADGEDVEPLEEEEEGEIQGRRKDQKAKL